MKDTNGRKFKIRPEAISAFNNIFLDFILNFLFSIAKIDKNIVIKRCIRKNIQTTANAIMDVNSSSCSTKS